MSVKHGSIFDSADHLGQFYFWPAFKNNSCRHVNKQACCLVSSLHKCLKCQGDDTVILSQVGQDILLQGHQETLTALQPSWDTCSQKWS